jgi:2'-hydroxyisoflavone reductase
MKQLLILGGANFIGRNLLEELEGNQEYEITLFNRGKTNTTLFPDFKRIIGDRNTKDIEQIGEQDWDYIIDSSCYYPASLEAILNCINKETLKRYVFISTCSVYDNKEKLETATPENGLLLSCTEEQKTSPLPAAYGEKKVACEQLLAQSGLDYVNLRPGLVYGTYDYTDRLYYWLHQVQQKNTILLPNNGSSLFSITYVDDLVQSILEALTISKHRIDYNILSQEYISIQKIVAVACQLLNRNPKNINASPSFLKEQNISEWTEMPLWIDGNYWTFSNQKLKTDFEFKLKDWTESIAATIDYYQQNNWPTPTYGMPEEKRLELLQLIQKK